MAHFRTITAFALTLILAACGGTNTPPTPVPAPPMTPEPAAPVISSFTATPSTISAGDDSVLAWSVDASATSISISGGVGTVVGDTGTETVAPTTTTIYTLTATNAEGTSTETTTVTVSGDPCLELGGCTPPGTDVEYYGEWSWTFIFDQTGSILTGQLSIVENVTTDSFSGSRGRYQLCAEDGTCDAIVEFGTGIIGDYALGSGVRLGMGLVNDLGGDSHVQLVGYDTDGQSAVNERGQEEMSGDGEWRFTNGGNTFPGSFFLTKISGLPVFQ